MVIVRLTRCDCGPQLHQAMRQVAEEGQGVSLHGAGRTWHRLAPKIKAYITGTGHDTVDEPTKSSAWNGLAEYG